MGENAYIRKQIEDAYWDACDRNLAARFRDMALNLANQMSGRPLALALTNLEQAYLWAKQGSAV